MRILITGGCGFLGSYVTDRLLAEGHEVVSLDNLDPQIHPTGNWPAYQPPQERLECVQADIRDLDSLYAIIGRVRPEVVIHLAAKVGVGQSALDPAVYVDVNARGTANLLQAMQDAGRPQRLIVASSMSCYGEGMYRRGPSGIRHGTFRGQLRDGADLLAGRWDGPNNVSQWPLPIPEAEPLNPASIYAESKATTERMALIWGAQHDVSTAACRFFNLWGPRQAPTNPYTGVIATFLSAALRGERPKVYEDGLQSRDFVHVRSAARVVAALATEHVTATGPFNVCTGAPVSIIGVAEACCSAAARVRDSADQARNGTARIAPEVTGQYRVGDIRHCIGDVSKLTARGISPGVREPYEYDLLDTAGLAEVARWMLDQDLTPRGDPHGEMQAAGLLLGGH